MPLMTRMPVLFMMAVLLTGCGGSGVDPDAPALQPPVVSQPAGGDGDSTGNGGSTPVSEPGVLEGSTDGSVIIRLDNGDLKIRGGSEVRVAASPDGQWQLVSWKGQDGLRHVMVNPFDDQPRTWTLPQPENTRNPEPWTADSLRLAVNDAGRAVLAWGVYAGLSMPYRAHVQVHDLTTGQVSAEFETEKGYGPVVAQVNAAGEVLFADERSHFRLYHPESDSWDEQAYEYSLRQPYVYMEGLPGIAVLQRFGDRAMAMLYRPGAGWQVSQLSAYRMKTLYALRSEEGDVHVLTINTEYGADRLQRMAVSWDDMQLHTMEAPDTDTVGLPLEAEVHEGEDHQWLGTTHCSEGVCNYVLVSLNAGGWGTRITIPDLAHAHPRCRVGKDATLIGCAWAGQQLYWRNASERRVVWEGEPRTWDVALTPTLGVVAWQTGGTEAPVTYVSKLYDMAGEAAAGAVAP